MILSGDQILKEVKQGRIVIRPFSPENINPNSYNVTLGDTVTIYRSRKTTDRHLNDLLELERPFPSVVLDAASENATWSFEIPDEGLIIFPGKVYLSPTMEWTETPYHAPILDGRSSGARLGLSIHQTGGFGDVGFKGNWTLEIQSVEPTRIYKGMKIAQMRFEKVEGDLRIKYKGKYCNSEKEVPCKLYEEQVGKNR